MLPILVLLTIIGFLTVDFLVGLGDGGALAAAALPDGGLPVVGLAERLTDGQWRQLTRCFFDPDADEEPSW